jgi:nucleoside 2-deoxyribosyltransferase
MLVYIIGALKNRSIPKLANEIEKLGIEAFDSWQSPGPMADSYLKTYERARGRNHLQAMKGHAAQHIFSFDKKFLDLCDAAVMVMKAGKSAHIELGYVIGKGKPGFILFDKPPARFDIMHLFATDMFYSKKDLLNALKKLKRRKK